MSKKGIELEFDVADRITVLNLKECAKQLTRENKHLMSLEKIKNHNRADLQYNTMLINHIAEVLRYFGEDL